MSGGKAFATRPAASELLDELKPGDRVIISKKDLASRDLGDAIEILKLFRTAVATCTCWISAAR